MIRLAVTVAALVALAFLVGGLVGWLLAMLLRPLVAGAMRERRPQRVVDAEPEPPLAIPLPAPMAPAMRRAAPLAMIEMPVAPREASTSREAPLRRAPPARIRPPALPGPRNGRADPLSRLAGLTRRHVERLHAIGVYHFSQIAVWTPREEEWVADHLDIEDPAVIEGWVVQAARLAADHRPPRG